VDVGSSRQADIAGFMGERLVNFAYAVVAVYASRQCLAFWRQSRAFEGACFAVMGLLTVLAKMYHIQAEAMSLVTLWHFYDRTLLVAFAYTVALLISLWLVWRGLALFQRGERLGGGYLLALAAILVANKLSPVAEGEVARAIMESRPTNPWGLLMLVYALAAFWALRAAFSQNRIAPAFAVLACFAASCATLLPSQTFDHVVLAAPPAFCVLALVFACSRRGAVNLLVVALLAALGLTAALDNKSQYWAYGPAAQQDTPLRSPRARLVRGEARIVGETEAVAECVRSLTSPKDSVFVCSGNVAIYFLAERKFFSTQFQTNKYPVPEVKSVFLKDLQRARVAVLVTKPLTTADISETEEAQRYVATHFSLAKQFEHYAVYLRQQTNPE
jgi:hypothetical protein